MTVDFYGFKVDVDYSGRLATAPGNPPMSSVAVNRKVGSVIHYAGGAQNRNLSALARWQSYARWHIRLGGFASGIIANGLMYHLGVDEDGLKAGLFNPNIMRWHAGSHTHNLNWLSFNIPIGGNQDATYAQKVGLDELLHQAWALGVGDRLRVIGHQEASWSLCPGVLQTSFVRPVRGGQTFAESQVPKKDKPDHIVMEVPGIGKFWIVQNMFKRWNSVEEPLFYFGYPLSGMSGNNTKVQDFERARFEWTEGSWPDRYDVRFGRIGVELASLKYPVEYNDKSDQFAPMDPHETERHRRYFSETGFSIAHGFKSFWEDWNGLEFFGYPISREFRESGRTVQYFERARFEHHPEIDWSSIYHNVSLGRVNAELIQLEKESLEIIVPPSRKNVSLESWIPVSQPVDVNVDAIVKVTTMHNRKPQYSQDKVRIIAEAIVRRAEEFHFRVSIVAGQIMHETGFFQFGNQVQPEQNNFAGLGATNDGAAGATFVSEDEGVLAVMCHLALYVYGDVHDWPAHLRKYADKAIRRKAVVDAHNNVRLPDGTRLLYLGTVSRIQDFVNGRWAWTPSVNYGSLENGYARSLVRTANEIIDAM